MPTLIRAEGFEHRAVSSSSFGTSVDGVGLFDLITNPGQISIDTTDFRSGTASLKIIESGNTNVQIGFVGTQTLVGSMYIRMTAAPATESRIVRHPGPTNSVKFIVQTDGAINTSISTSGTAGPVITDGAWHRLDWRVLTNGTTHSVEWAVDGAGQTTQSLGGQSAQNMTDLEFGSTQASANATIWYDDLVLSVTSGDYPMGAHKVLSLSPTGDGTHNSGVNIIEDQAGTDITSPNAFPLLDEIPAGTTDYIRQFAGGSGNYAEVTFADTSETTIWGVMGVTALGGGVSSATGRTRIVDSANATLTDINVDNFGFSNGVEYKVKMITDPGGDGWSQSDLNGVKGRVGFATGSEPRWHGLLLEYAAAEAAPAGGGLVDPFGMMGFFGG